MHKPYTLLALGDSYTIGESLPLIYSFPYQVVQNLRKGHPVAAPEIIAKTGWTTDELATAISHYRFSEQYDFVTLGIGVNNQYRGRTVEEFKIEFENLLKSAIHFAGGKGSHVLVLSIPDYSNTPFAQKMDTAKIETEIALFNSVIKAVSIQYKTIFVDITTGAKEEKDDADHLAPDGLHPSKKEYGRWSVKIVHAIKELLG